MWVTNYDSGFTVLTFISSTFLWVKEVKAKIPIPNQSKP